MAQGSQGTTARGRARPDVRSDLISPSWKRSAQSGLEPGSPVCEGGLEEVDADSRLVRAAAPVIDELGEDLQGTAFSLLLADRDACIVARRLGRRQAGRALDDVLAVPGAVFTERLAGTNALSTAYEVQRGLSVVGDEHYLESLKGFGCFAQPILHPVTGVLEGVLDITGPAGEASGLMAPLVVRAAQDIADRLALGSRTSHQRMLTALQARSRSSRPVLVFGPDLVLANAAADLVVDEPVRHELRRLCSGLDSRERSPMEAPIPGDTGLSARFSSVPGAPDAFVCELHLDSVIAPRIPRGANARQALTETLAGHRAAGTSVLVCGERGTGRTRVAQELAGPRGCIVESAARVQELQAILDRATPHGPLVVIQDLSLLTDADADRLARTIDQTTAWIAITSLPPTGLSDAQRALAARCPAQVNIPALRERRTELGEAARDVLRRHSLSVRLTPGTVRAMERHDWPGNIRELETALLSAAQRCAGDVILPDDLPAHVRHAPGRGLGPLQQAERDAIIACLARHQWNKAQTAAELGIGRNTLYRMMRNLGIRD